jgi:hypothetical protein
MCPIEMVKIANEYPIEKGEYSGREYSKGAAPRKRATSAARPAEQPPPYRPYCMRFSRAEKDFFLSREPASLAVGIGVFTASLIAL